MTELVAYHRKTCDLALFSSEGQYWIGSYDENLRHQNGEPSYVLIRGYFSTQQEGEEVLRSLKGDEF